MGSEVGAFVHEVGWRIWFAGKLIYEHPELFMFAVAAFSVATRKLIGRRDDWTCQDPECDDGMGQARSFRNGWMVQAAHNPENHSKSDPMYDDPSSGDIRCIDHHQEQHEHGTSLGYRGDEYAVSRLEETDRRTRWWRQKN